MTADSLFNAPGYRAAVSVVISSPAALRANPGLVSKAVLEITKFLAELSTLRTDPANCRRAPEIEALDADPGLAGRLLDDAGFVRSLAIRAALHMVESASRHLTAVFLPAG